MASAPGNPENTSDAWPEGWRVELDVIDGADRAGWQASLWFEGRRVCRLCAFNCAEDAAAARAHAHRRLRQWIAEWQVRADPPDLATTPIFHGAL